MISIQEMTHKHTRELDIFFNEHHDRCTLCGRDFADGDTSHLGYIKNREQALLCDECSRQLKETVVRYHWMKRVYEVPAPTDLLWRYMDLSKFIFLIEKQELFFSVAKNFSDPFEGAKGIETRKDKWDSFYTEFFKKAILTIPEADPMRFSEEELSSEAQRLLFDLHLGGQAARDYTFINCWHLSSYESEAMWRLYAKDITNAIAIQTTFQRLYEALYKEPTIAIGKIQYIDFSKRFTSVNDAFWYKQKSFDHEKEVRLVAVDNARRGQPGVSFPIDINLLIESIYVSPYAPLWFYDVVESILDKYCLGKSILQSQMKAIPFY